ncbi:hypothetical protein [Fulvivirga sediminis]|uniref:Outer membrane protein beta-barrel domain-containing protein n=1 Tax=Fulvivirga sediminis TaxID=2803949 RepID=A0A937K2W8_9BACT|nr:hypothetical protein [Fulvivirga sediminis]MBL3658302.1 hypothetical protein [Fulvivirga sediminis]
MAKNTRFPILCIIFFMGLNLLCCSQGYGQQDIYWEKKFNPADRSFLKYRGIGVSFGVKSITFDSKIDQLHSYQTMQEGGKGSLVIGNDFDQISFNVAGWYYSSSQKTIDLFEFGITNHLYFLRAFGIKPQGIAPYVISGVRRQRYKFYGAYVDEDDRGDKGQQRGPESYLGGMQSTSLSLGLGVEYQLQSELEFIHFFAEAAGDLSFMSSVDGKAFIGTKTGHLYSFNLGVRFGLKKTNFRYLR